MAQALGNGLEEGLVLEDAAGEGDGGKSPLGSQAAREIGRTLGESEMKTRGHAPPVLAPGQITQESFPHGRRIQQPPPPRRDQAKGIGPALLLRNGFQRQGLQFDGGLALVGDDVTADAQGGGDGIEEAAGELVRGVLRPRAIMVSRVAKGLVAR